MAIALIDFRNKYTGKSADVPWSPHHNNFRGECVSLIVRYLNECFDIPMDARGNAKDYAWSLVNADLGYKVTAAQYGDILVYGANAGDRNGHIAVALGNGLMFDQNNNGDRTAQVRNLLRVDPIAIIRINRALIPDKVPTKKYLQLSKDVDRWRVYPLDKAPVIKNASGTLLPSKFGGLEYEILELKTNVAIIQTRDFGKVQIWIGKETAHTIIER